MTQPKAKIRLYVSAGCEAGAQIALDVGQSHYLAQVMRLKAGDVLLVFNGRDGEWLAEIVRQDKKQTIAECKKQIRPQTASPDLWLAFAPIKNKTDLVVEKATELGVSKIIPVVTHYTVVRSVNGEKLTAYAIEAAEQCERLDMPKIEPCVDLPALLGNWPKERTLLYGDETGGGMSFKRLLSDEARPTYAILIGPEGGFSPDEHALLKRLPFVKAFSLGPRILRADTAAVAALACLQAFAGDWEKKDA